MLRRPGIRHVRAPTQDAYSCEPTILGPQLTLWLRSTIGVIRASGKVSQWTDQSGKGANFVQATEELKPDYVAVNGNFNAKPSVDLTAAGALLTSASSIAIRHLLVVANHPNALFPDNDALVTHGSDAFLRGDDNTANWLPDNDVFIGAIYRDGSRTNQALDVPNRAHVYEYLFNSLQTVASWRIGDDAGGGDQWRGSVVEIIGCRDIIPDRTARGIRQMLRVRYGTP